MALSGLVEPVRVEWNARSLPSASMTAWELTDPTSMPTVMAEAARQSISGACQVFSLHRQKCCWGSVIVGLVYYRGFPVRPKLENGSGSEGP